MSPQVGCTGSTYRFVSHEETNLANPAERRSRIAGEILLQIACALTVLAIAGAALMK